MLSRRHLLVRLSLLSALGLAMPPGRVAADRATDNAVALIEKLGSQALSLLNDPAISAEDSINGFRKLLEEGFDGPYIGRFVLGRYWSMATPEQQAEYLELFEKLVVRAYADRFSQYSGRGLRLKETLRLLGARPEGTSDVVVATQIVRPDGPPVRVDWRVRERNGTAKVIDVAVEGISMGLTQRQEFAAVIQRGGGRIEALLEALRHQVGAI